MGTGRKYLSPSIAHIHLEAAAAGQHDGAGLPDLAVLLALDVADLGQDAAQLVVVEPFWYTDARPDSVDEIIGWVEAAAADVGAEYVPGASRWLEGHPEWMAADGIHPNDDGYAELARRMEAELARLGL